MIKNEDSFSPDWLSPPGDTIADLLEERDWTQAQLAEQLGHTTEFVNQLVTGKVHIDEAVAVQLAKALGSTAQFWLNREYQYRERLAQIEGIAPAVTFSA